MSINSPCDSKPNSTAFSHHFGEHDALFNVVVLLTCTVNLLLSPVAMAGNTLVLTSIWRNPSLKTPSYLILGGLAFTDFFTGLLIQPLYAVNVLAEFKENTQLFCIANRILDQVGPYFFTVTMETISFMSIERWLHMSRRSLITKGRVCKIFGVFLLLPVFYLAFRPVSNVLIFFFGILCFVLTSVAYYKVFKIVRQHQQQVQVNQQAIDAAKYKKSVFTVLFILLLFLASYIPNWLCLTILASFASNLESGYVVVLYFTATVLYASSSLNPILYCWRINEIRSSVRQLLKTMFCHS